MVFDLGGVLIDWDPRHLFCGPLGIARTDAERFLATVCTPEWHAGIDGGRPFGQATTALAARFPQYREWILAYASGWEQMFAGELEEGAACLSELRDRGYRVHALSNYPGERIEFLYRRFAFMAEFDTVILSGVVGLLKPAPAMFDYLCRCIGTRNCLFVDDRAENVEAAGRFGIEAMRYTGADSALTLLERSGL